MQIIDSGNAKYWFSQLLLRFTGYGHATKPYGTPTTKGYQGPASPEYPVPSTGQ
jgi:hypothetical protein